jgi:hypothetical protein
MDEAKVQRIAMRRRNWRNYSPELLTEELQKVEWQTGIENVQELWNSIEQEILTVIDKMVPLEEINTFINRGKNSAMIKKKLNRRNYLLKKRKRSVQREEEKEELAKLNKYIKSFYFEERKQHVRKKIIPGNNKSLWDAVKIAKDIEPTPLPTTVTKGGLNYSGKDVPAAFSSFLKSKIVDLEENLTTHDGVYNGRKLINSEEMNFMTEDKVTECLNELKIKNCEGYDRIPMRILKDGASILRNPLSDLFGKIYKKKEIPEQWKVAKIIPLHKKGNKHDVANYRPISNLCSVSKVFEKLIQKRLEQIGEDNNVDITGEQQHGFKKNRSTITAGLTIQSIISREMDEDKFVVMSSLDLSAAFDLVNLDLLLKRLKKMGLPNDLTSLLEVWLRNRFFYVEANGHNSMVLNSDIGTVQGSILGPILYALFIRPLYDLEKLTTFADDNYVIGYHKEKDLALKELGEKLVRIVKWLKDSGLKVNEKKTEVCIFHRTKNTDGNLNIDNTTIPSKFEMNVLGLTFDSRLNWGPQVSRAIKGANNSLQAIKMIRKYFKTSEIIQLLTSNFYSKLYYGSEIWHLPNLNSNCKKLLLSASANALKLCNATYDPNISYVDLHKLHKRALPSKFCTYRHCLLLFKVFNNMILNRDWLNLNFQMINTSRQTLFEIQSCAVYKVGNNILTNRLSCLNRKIRLDFLNLSFETYKIKCKSLFLL